MQTYKGDGHGNCLKPKSIGVVKGFTQVQYLDYHETTPPTPASTPVKMIAAIANEKGLPVFHLDVSQALCRSLLRRKFICASSPVAVNSLVKP